MTSVLVLGISLAGGAGAATRYAADQALTKWLQSPRFARRLGSAQGWGIAVVNITGSFVLGVLAGPLGLTAWGPVVTMGFLGGYTTFSTASLNALRIALDGGARRGIAHALATYVLSIVAAGTGLALSAALFAAAG